MDPVRRRWPALLPHRLARRAMGPVDRVELMAEKIAKWRLGEDGILAAIIARAKRDWKSIIDIEPEKAHEMGMATTYGRASLPYRVCRNAFFQGFDCPQDEIIAFFESDGLLNLLILADLDWMIERIQRFMGDDHG